MKAHFCGVLAATAAWIVPATVAVAACGGDDPLPAPPPLATGSSQRPPPDGGEGARDALVLEASATATSWAGTLASTDTVPFGGGAYCNYEMTLKDVAIELTILETGYVGTAAVRDLVVEKAIDCPFPPMEPSIQDFGLKQSVTTAPGTRIDFSGSKNNRPETSLVADLVALADGYEATLTWKRTDQGPPLDWTVTAKVKLARK